jgi:signal peptidase I
MEQKAKSKTSIKEVWKKVWNFIWKDESIWSWIVSLILAFIIVKFIFFPLLSLAFATSLPLVVVESGSMHHPGGFIGNTLGLQSNFETWWQQAEYWYLEKGISKETAKEWPLRTGLEIGDIVLVSGHGKDNLKVGDIIIFEAGQAHPLIHRIMEIKNVSGKIYYSTKGDNNPDQLPVEKQISEEQIIGKALFSIPKLGWVKLAFAKIFS